MCGFFQKIRGGKNMGENVFRRAKTVADQVADQVESALQEANRLGEPDRVAVRQLNEEGIHLGVQQGRFEEALASFLEGLRKRGHDLQLRADSLMNMGDMLRRGPGDLDLARKLFVMAELMPLSFTRRSRLRTMEAMLYIHATEQGKNDPWGIAKNLALLEEAIVLADAATQENPEESWAAKLFAAHRYLGTICVFGNPDQKAKGLRLIHQLLHLLDPNSPSAARFKYSQSLIVRSEYPQESVMLLMQSAERMKEEFPLDAGAYLALAGLICIEDLKDTEQAEEYWKQAEEFRERIAKFSNSGYVIVTLDKLKQALEK